MRSLRMSAFLLVSCFLLKDVPASDALDATSELPIISKVGEFRNVAPLIRLVSFKSSPLVAKWLNDRELILSIPTTGEGSRPSDGQRMEMATWDTASGKLTRHFHGRLVCVSPEDGYVQIERLVERDPNKPLGRAVRVEMLRGIWGQDALEPYEYRPVGETEWHVINPITCRTEIEKKRGGKESRQAVTLYEGQGRFERTVGPAFNRLAWEWEYIQDERNLNIKISIGDEEGNQIAYLPFSKSYLIFDTIQMNAHTSTNHRRRVWRVDLDGRVTAIPTPDPLWQWARKDIPHNRKVALLIKPRISRLGMLWSVEPYIDRSLVQRLQDRRPGCYLQREGALYKLKHGLCGDVSPDGCRALTERVVSQSDYAAEIEFEIVDYCKGGESWR